MSPRQEESACPECGTSNPPGSKFCESCGLVITSSVRSESGEAPQKKRKRAAPEKSEAREIEQALARARGLLKNVRALFIIFGVGSLLPTIFILTAAFTDVPDLMVYGLISALFTIVLFGGAFFLFLQPLFWTVSVAAFSTLLAILLIPNPIYVVGFGVIAFGLWASLPMVLNIMRLKIDFPNLITSEKLKSREKRDVGTSAARVRAAERRALDRKRALKTYGIVAGVFIAAIITIIVIKSWPDPTTASAGSSNGVKISEAQMKQLKDAFGPTIKRFEETWAASDEDGVRALLDAGYASMRWGRILRSLREHDYEKEFPDLEESEVFPRGDPLERDVWFEWDSGTLKTRWRFDLNGEDKWEIIKVVLKYS